MAILSAAMVDQTMAIAMPSGRHVPAVVKQECVVDCRPSAEKQRSFIVGASDDQSRACHIDQNRFKHWLLPYWFCMGSDEGGVDCVSSAQSIRKIAGPRLF
jgi:hypothetical protein